MSLWIYNKIFFFIQRFVKQLTMNSQHFAIGSSHSQLDNLQLHVPVHWNGKHIYIFNISLIMSLFIAKSIGF